MVHEPILPDMKNTLLKMKYAIAKKLFSTALNCFYSRADMHGHLDIPKDQPVLFVSNHSNAFIDPLLLTARLDRSVTFTAKNTLARNPISKMILKSVSVELLSRKLIGMRVIMA